MKRTVKISDLSQEEIQLVLDAKARRKQRITMVLPYVGIVLLLLFFSLFTDGKFFQIDNFKLLVSQCFTTTIVVMGCAFLYAEGCLDMAVGAVMAVSTLVLTRSILNLQLPIGIALLLAVVVSIFFMSITALTKNFLHVEAFVASMCILYLCSGIVQISEADGTTYFPYSAYKYFDSPVIKTVTLIVLFGIGYVLFNYTRVGKSLKAIGGNSVVAKISGINLNWFNWIADTLCAVTLAIAGLFSVVRTGQVDSAAGSGLNLNVITAVVLGGSPLTGGTNSRFLSPVLGSLMVTILTNGLALMGYANAIGYFIKGVMFLVVVGLTYERSKGKLIS